MPFPIVLSRGIVKFVDGIFAIRVGQLRIFTVITFCAFVALVAQTLDLQKRYQMLDTNKGSDAGFGTDLQVSSDQFCVIHDTVSTQ